MNNHTFVFGSGSPSLLHLQGSRTTGDSGEEIHPDPAEVHQERVEIGQNRLRRDCGLRPLLVTVRLCHADFLGWVRLIACSEAFGVSLDFCCLLCCLRFTD